MSMRINSLFEHDASMKRQIEEREKSQAMTSSNNLFEQPVVELPEAPRPKQRTASTNKKETGEKSEKGRHRASIACAACRDRRIRVSPGIQLPYKTTLIRYSAWYRLENETVRSVNGRKQSVSLEMTTKEEGKFNHPIIQESYADIADLSPKHMYHPSRIEWQC
jgi:hypothetical protein